MATRDGNQDHRRRQRGSAGRKESDAGRRATAGGLAGLETAGAAGPYPSLAKWNPQLAALFLPRRNCWWRAIRACPGTGPKKPPPSSRNQKKEKESKSKTGKKSGDQRSASRGTGANTVQLGGKVAAARCVPHQLQSPKLLVLQERFQADVHLLVA